MARLPRVVIPHCPHHVTQRGNRRQKTFFHEGDYRYYKSLLARYAEKTNTEIWAYCLMPNHVHFVMVPETEDGLRATLGEAHRRYTTMVNERHGWRGHLWQERFHSFPMDEFHLLATARYVEMNPVAANLCYLPEDWKWSSAIAHLTGTDDGLVRVQPMLDRVDDWKSFLSSYIETEPVNMIRKHSRTGRPLGNNSFVNHLEELTGRKLRPRTRGPGQKMLD